MFKGDEDSQSQCMQHSDVHVPTLHSTSSSTSGRSLKRMISDVSVDSHGWPTCLAEQLRPELVDDYPAPDSDHESEHGDAMLSVLLGFVQSGDCKAKATPKVKNAHVKLDTYGHAKALFEVKHPEGNWQNSQARHEAAQLMLEVDVRRRRFEKLRPDLFLMVDGKWKAIDMENRYR